jgi:hypothetical protein
LCVALIPSIADRGVGTVSVEKISIAVRSKAATKACQSATRRRNGDIGRAIAQPACGAAQESASVYWVVSRRIRPFSAM